jgi:cystathionine beta-lyase/cystathionine gamma-synthase
MIHEPQSTPGAACDELADYRREIGAIVAKEREHLAEQAQALSRLAGDAGLEGIEARVVEWALESVRRADDRLRELADLPWRFGQEEAFNGLITFAGAAFRESIAARTQLLRHTPTLMGAPAALDPRQHHRLNRGDHIIDYARNAYLQYQETRSGSPKVLVDNPILAECAASITRTLHGDDARIRSVLFSSALGAVNSLIDLLVMAKGGNQRRFVLGRRCWFEIGQYAAERFPSRFYEVDEHDTGSILAALEDPEVAGIVLEPLGNHPDMPVVDLDAVARRLMSARLESPKLLVLDAVHTPDLDVFSRWFGGELPDGLAVAVVVSGVKFLQAGWDISKSGLVSVRCGRGWGDGGGNGIMERLVEIRSVSGRAPSFEEALLADLETPASFRSRMARYDANTRRLARELDAWLRLHRLGSVRSPWIPTHERHQLAMACHRTGGRVLFVALDRERIGESEMGELFKHLARAAEQRGLHLVAAPTFGMAVPHIHVVIRPGLPTTLRLSPGSTGGRTLDRLIDFLRDELGRRLKNPPVRACLSDSRCP